MTKIELIKALEPYPDDIIIYVNIESDYAHSVPVEIIHEYDNGIELL